MFIFFFFYVPSPDVSLEEYLKSLEEISNAIEEVVNG